MALELSNIRILNYKSIDEVSLDVKKYNNSYTTIFVGKNETGKSNLLDSIQFVSMSNEEFIYEELKNSQNDDANYVDFYYTYKFSKDKEWKDILKNKLNAHPEFLDKIEVNGVRCNIYLEKGENKLKFINSIQFTQLSEAFLGKYSYLELVKSNDTDKNYDIQLTNNLSGENLATNIDETTSNKEIYKQLSSKELSSILSLIFEDVLKANKLNVSKWKHSKEYLITETIDLKIFKSDYTICYPLKNIFNLAGYKTQEDILNKINELSGSTKNINKLEKQLEKILTEYVNKVWAECKIRFEIKIQNDLKLDVFIFDEADKDNSYYMSDRSEGFKQFVSLILSISAANETDTIKNNVILIDEPEVHMHPSGIRYMRNELLRIGENNYVFIATHSQFMIDTNNKERHYIVSKPNNNTCVKVWDSTKDLSDDEILRQAFGINVLNDLLAKHRMLVEGFSDCKIFEKALATLLPNNCITITNGTGSNIVAVASMLKMYNVPVLTLVDADRAGEKYKKEIIKLGASFNENTVKTLRDFVAEIIDYGTIEDTLDKEFVLKNLKKAYAEITKNKTCSFEYAEEKPVLEEFRTFLNKESIEKTTANEIIENAKCKIATEFKPTTTNLKNKHSKLSEICNKILEYFNSAN